MKNQSKLRYRTFQLREELGIKLALEFKPEALTGKVPEGHAVIARLEVLEDPPARVGAQERSLPLV